MVLFLQKGDTATTLIFESELRCFRQQYLASCGFTVCTVQGVHVVYSKTSLQWSHMMQNMWGLSATLCIPYTFSFEWMFSLCIHQVFTIAKFFMTSTLLVTGLDFTSFFHTFIYVYIVLWINKFKKVIPWCFTKKLFNATAFSFHQPPTPKHFYNHWSVLQIHSFIIFRI